MVSMRGYSQFRLPHERSEENYLCYRARYQQPVEARKESTICSKPVSSFTFFIYGRSAFSRSASVGEISTLQSPAIDQRKMERAEEKGA